MINISRKMDIVFCIDGTASMYSCIDNIRKHAKSFYQEVDYIFTENGDTLDCLNVKVITFRDYKKDGSNAMIESEWYDLTAGEEDDFEKYLSGIIADGGGDEPENGLEALFQAMCVKWNAMGDRDIQAIVLFTDADAHPLKDREGIDGYPANMVDEEGFIKAWYCVRPGFLSQEEFSLRERCKRLVIFAPVGTIYERLSTILNRSVYKPVGKNLGLSDIGIKELFKLLKKSPSAIS